MTERRMNTFATPESTSGRKMATIRRISELQPIDGADRIELAVVDGWKVIVKKGEYQVGSLAVYLEIDSWVPHTVAPFLTKSGHFPKVYQGIEGQRLKSVKMKGVTSQGLLLPLSTPFTINKEIIYEALLDQEGSDVTEVLGIVKWEKEIPANLRGVQRGNFPSEIRKTDQERIQNLSKKFEQLKHDHIWEVTEKLHGSSATYYLDTQGVFHVCSRNIDLQKVEGNTFWDISDEYSIEENMQIAFANDPDTIGGIAIQGELIGPGINGNQYGCTEPAFFVFDLQHVQDGYAPAEYRYEISKVLGLPHAPVVHEAFTIPQEWTIEDLLTFAEGKSLINASEREGLVFKSLNDPEVTFKVVSNKWLLAGGEDQ